MSLPVVILAGGLATRLGPITRRLPKSLVDIGGRPFAVRQIELLQRNGITDITFLIGHLGQMIVDALGDGQRWGVRIHYAPDGPRPLGTGGAVRNALHMLDDPFFVVYGDSYLDCDYAAIERAFRGGTRLALMTVCRNDDRWDRSNVLFSAGRIIRYDKRRHSAEMRHIDYGLGVFRRAAFACRAADETFDLETLYQDLLGRDQLDGFEVPSRFYEIGSPAGLEDTRTFLAGKDAALR